VIFILGFASGLPLLLTGSTFKLWLSQEKIDIKTIGLMSLVGLSYSLKFLWAPLLDRYYLPFLGRRKTWLVLTQLSLALGLFFISQLNPTDHLMMMATWAVFIAFMSATQDITIDAYRTELLTAEETGIGSSVGVYGYRLAMWITGGVLVALVADNSAELSTRISWAGLYQIVAGIFLLLALLHILQWCPFLLILQEQFLLLFGFL
jgi:PAT family beta-lactamase induction signal transducer AmpG